MLVADGLSNGQIAARLVLSERTVDHHVGAILRKLRSTRDRSERKSGSPRARPDGIERRRGPAAPRSAVHPWLNGVTSGFVLANSPDGFGYQSQTCIVMSRGCQKVNAAPD